MTVEFWDSSLANWFVLPLLIFVARVCDVTIGTVRLLFISQGRKYLAPVLGFVEVTIWLLAIRQIMGHMNNVACYLGFAGGFATGNYIGMLIEEKLALGVQVVRCVTSQDSGQLVAALKQRNFGVTRVEAHGGTGQVHVVYTIVPRKNLPEVETLIRQFNPKAFYTIEDIKYVSEGIFPAARGSF